MCLQKAVFYQEWLFTNYRQDAFNPIETRVLSLFKTLIILHRERIWK